MTGPLGDIVVLTDRVQAAAAGHELTAVVRAAASGGADTVILREKDLGPDARLALGRSVVDALAGTATRLVVASDLALARSLDAAGVHLAQRDEAVRVPDPNSWLVGRSCHDAAEVAAAWAEDIDYVTVSPVFTTASKPDHGPPLGPAGAMALSSSGSGDRPVYALGGVTADNAGACLQAGSSGVAVMGAVMASPDPRATVERLVAAMAPAAQVAR